MKKSLPQKILFMAIVFCLVLFTPEISTKATAASESSSTLYQTTANVNLRAGASSKHKVILTIPKGKNVTYLSKSGSWYKVKYANKTGYVSSSYLKKPTTSKPATGTSITYQTTASVNLRAGASTKHKVIVTIPKGKNVTYLSKSGKWYKVKYANKTGYVSSTYLKKPTTSQSNTGAAVTYQTTTNANLMDGASTKHKVILTIPKGKNVTYISKTGSWYKVQYGNKTGFINSAYLIKPGQAAVPNYKLTRYYDTNIHVYTSNPNAQLAVSKGKPNVLESLSSITLPNEIAKTNMGFFDSKMEHGGLFMVNGQVTSNHKPKYIIMEYKKTGKIDIRSLANILSGNNLMIDQELENMKGSNYFAVGTSYSLIQDGKRNLAHSEYFANSKNRNPRTMFGQTKDGRFIMAVTDGRVNGSSGLTASQSADVMLKLGAVEAVNLDGGGSSTLYIGGNLMNKLGESPRKIGSALFILK